MKKKKKIIILLLLLVALLFVSIAFATISIKLDEKEIKKTDINHTVPAEDPFFGVGAEYLIGGGIVYGLFNETMVYSDTNNDGIYDYRETINASEIISLEASHPGSRIFANKPIVYEKLWEYQTETHGGPYADGRYEDHYWYRYKYNSVPPASSLKNHYYVYSGNWNIAGIPGSIVSIDEELDETIDDQVIITLNGNTISVSQYAKLSSTVPFCCYNNDDAFIGPPGSDFYVAKSQVYKMLVLENDTDIQIDTNNDGIYDLFIENNVGEYGPYDWTDGSHVHSNNQIMLFGQTRVHDTTHTFYYPPSNTIGNDVYIRGESSWHPPFIIGVFSNTTLYGANVYKDGTQPEWNDTIGANEIKELDWSVENTKHVWGTKPLLTRSYGEHTNFYWQAKHHYEKYYYCSVYPFPYSFISSVVLHEPNEIGLNKNVNMEVRVFNPFADTEINDVSAMVKVDDDFSLSGGSTLDVTVAKLYLRNDTEIGSSTFTVAPTLGSGNYVFTVSDANTALLQSLGPMQYYKITYQITSPSTMMTYHFEPVNVQYDASTWVLPS